MSAYPECKHGHNHPMHRCEQCDLENMAFRVAKAMRAAEGLDEPEQAISAAKQALSDAVNSLERLPNTEGAFRITVMGQCREALALLTGKSA